MSKKKDEIALNPPRSLAPGQDEIAQELLNDVMALLAPTTRKTYFGCLERYAKWRWNGFEGHVWGAFLELVGGLPEGGPAGFTKKQARYALMKFRNHMLDLGLSNNYVALHLRAISSLSEKLYETGHANHIVKVSAPKTPISTSKERSLPPELVDEIFAGLEAEGTVRSKRDLAALYLLHDSGLRSKEARGIVWPRDVDLNRDPPMVKIKGKGRSEREPWPVSTRCAQAIQDWVEVRGNAKGPLLCVVPVSDKPKTLNANRLWNIFHRLKRLSGYKGKLGPHLLRHHKISTLARAGVSQWDLAKFARHSDPKTTMIYIHQDQKEMADLAELGNEEKEEENDD